MNPKSILVTGGAGFIGSNLVDRLIAADDCRVTAVDDLNDFYDPELKRSNIARHLGDDRYRFVKADIRDEAAMREVFSEGFDAVVHLAARAGVRPSLSDPRLYVETNVNGTLTLLECCKDYNVKQLVFGSSSSVYGENEKLPFAEDDPIVRPISPYAATKAAGEMLCHTYSHLYGIRVIALRFFTVYGPRQRPDLAIHKFARSIMNGTPIPVFGDGTTRRDYTYVDDIVDGVVAAMDYDASNYEIFNLGESETTELSRLIELLEGALHRTAVIDRRPTQPGDVPVTYADISKARALLGYRPQTKIESGIPKFVEWLKEGN